MTESKQTMTYTVAEAAKLLRIGRNQAYEAINARELPSVKIGRRILIPRVALEQMLAKSSAIAA
jgi:excisionase family DNA binding protein